MKFREYFNIRKWLNISTNAYENIKTVLLWILVLTSLMLTYSLWTYNPRYEVLRNQATVESVQIDPTGKRTISEVIRPSQVVYFEGGEEYSLISSKEMQDQLYNHLLETPFVNKEEAMFKSLQDMKEPNTFIEFVFPTRLSPKIIKELFNMEEEQILLANIDRVYLYEKVTNDVSNVYLRLVSYEQEKYLDLDIQLDYQAIVKDIQKASHLDYFKFYIRDTNNEIEDVVYLPKQKVDMISHPIKFVRTVSEENFKNALFGDPSFVNREASANRVNYTDGKKVLSVSLGTYEMTYRSIVTDNIEQVNTGLDIIIQSLQFVNKHYGWTDKYLLFDEKDQDTTSFRMEIDGLPVLNSLGLIQLKWDKGYIYEYNRSLINISYEYPRDFFDERINEKVETNRWPSLMSGYEVIDILKNSVGLSNVKNIMIGYEMKKYNDSYTFYEFVPNWYYYNGEQWISVVSLVGGNNHGLERD